MGTMRIVNTAYLSASPATLGRWERRKEEIIHKVDKVPYFTRDQLSLSLFLSFRGKKSDLEGIKIPQGVFNLFSLQGQVPHVALKRIQKNESKCLEHRKEISIYTKHLPLFKKSHFSFINFTSRHCIILML